MGHSFRERRQLLLWGNAFRFARFLSPILLLTLMAGVADLDGQVRRDMGRTVREVSPLSEGEAAEFLGEFLRSRGGGDSFFEAELIHYPRRGERQVFPAQIFSRWRGSVLWLRVEVREPENQRDRIFLFRGGATPLGWSVAENGEVEELDGQKLLQPLLPGLDLTAFDLTSPYLDWPGPRYEGSERVADSPAHWFRFELPNQWRSLFAEHDIASVRVAIDARFKAPVRVEYIDPDGGVLRTIDVRSFKKAGDTWYVRRLEGFDEQTRDRTELRVNGAEVELTLDPSLFDPSFPSL